MRTQGGGRKRTGQGGAASPRTRGQGRGNDISCLQIRATVQKQQQRRRRQHQHSCGTAPGLPPNSKTPARCTWSPFPAASANFCRRCARRELGHVSHLANVHPSFLEDLPRHRKRARTKKKTMYSVARMRVESGLGSGKNGFLFMRLFGGRGQAGCET